VAQPRNNLAQDLAGLRLEGSEGSDGTVSRDDRPLPEMSMKRAELVEKLRAEAEAQTRKGVSLVVIGTCGDLATEEGFLTFCGASRPCRRRQIHLDGSVIVRAGRAVRKGKDCERAWQ
jgi:hypothetical protein